VALRCRTQLESLPVLLQELSLVLPQVRALPLQAWQTDPETLRAPCRRPKQD
jgi:hypothetical protein